MPNTKTPPEIPILYQEPHPLYEHIRTLILQSTFASDIDIVLFNYLSLRVFESPHSGPELIASVVLTAPERIALTLFLALIDYYGY